MTFAQKVTLDTNVALDYIWQHAETGMEFEIVDVLVVVSVTPDHFVALCKFDNGLPVMVYAYEWTAPARYGWDGEVEPGDYGVEITLEKF